MKETCRINWFEKEQISSAVEEAAGVLENTGVLIESGEALGLLAERGVRTERERAYFSAGDIEKALEAAPGSVTLFGRDDASQVEIGENRLHFNPGSSAIRILDMELNESRVPKTQDLVDFALLTGSLRGYSLQSTALVPNDVPGEIADSYRLYLALTFSEKPVVTGTFTEEGYSPMLRMMEIVCGGAEELRRRPIAIFDICPTAPLSWSGLAANTLLACVRSGVPVQIVPMPLAGATSPATLYGTIVQHCAENLSGIAISQIVAPGAPVVYGGSPAYFDMRKGTTPVGAVEAAIINGAGAEIAAELGLPSHAYMAISDSKSIDYQNGMETAMSAAVAALSRVNNVSGPGMHNFQTVQSMEKLILDNEICLMAQRLRSGIGMDGCEEIGEVIAEGTEGGSFLTLPHTLRKFREEALFPGAVIDREAGEKSYAPSAEEIIARAAAEKRKILDREREGVLTGKRSKALREVVEKMAWRAGMNKVPYIEGREE